LVGFCSTIIFLFTNVQTNLARQNIASGFEFLSLEAGFEIGETLIDYFSDDSYGKALWAGVLNTLKVALVGNILAVIVGVFVGIMRLSSNWLVSKVAYIYIECLRNIPLLLQLFFWYALFTDIFPSVRQAYNPFSWLFLSNRGVSFPLPKNIFEYKVLFVVLIVTLLVSIFIYFKGKRKEELTGSSFAYFKISISLIIGVPLITWLSLGLPMEFDVPVLRAFNFSGGYTLSPEFSALLIGLVLYTGAFIAEIVRSGIVAVDKGQWEASKSLGLNSIQTLFLIILPQALRVIIPPLTSQLLNLTKNSSLAVAIGYPDFVSVANTSMNQTGQAIELVSLIMLVYLIFSLITSLFMNFYNKKIALVER
jgi:general L-amino acid transport system permease protein